MNELRDNLYQILKHYKSRLLKVTTKEEIDDTLRKIKGLSERIRKINFEKQMKNEEDLKQLKIMRR